MKKRHLLGYAQARANISSILNELQIPYAPAHGIYDQTHAIYAQSHGSQDAIFSYKYCKING